MHTCINIRRHAADRAGALPRPAGQEGRRAQEGLGGAVPSCMRIYIYIYIHIYIEREREREREAYIYIYIYVYVHIV